MKRISVCGQNKVLATFGFPWILNPSVSAHSTLQLRLLYSEVLGTPCDIRKRVLRVKSFPQSCGGQQLLSTGGIQIQEAHMCSTGVYSFAGNIALQS